MYRQEQNVWQCCVRQGKSLLYMTTADHARTLCHMSVDCEPSRIMSVFVSTSEQESKLCTSRCSKKDFSKMAITSKCGMVFMYTCKFDFMYLQKNSITCPEPLFMTFTNSEQHLIPNFTQICHQVSKVQNVCPQ
jgi:hypothetical protein